MNYIVNRIFMPFLARFEWKTFKRFSFWDIFYDWNNYSGKTKCANDLKFCTKISCLNLHQMVYLSGKNIFTPIMSKNLSGVPLKGLLSSLVDRCKINLQELVFKWYMSSFLYLLFTCFTFLDFYQTKFDAGAIKPSYWRPKIWLS
jgi:hypothetical protein